MSKLKRQLRAYFDENLSHTDQYDKIAIKANLQSTKKESKFYMSKKLLLRIALPCFLGLALIGTVVAVSLSRRVVEQPGDSTPTAVIQMDVNPSLSLVVDNNNVVLSVYGENDEGKMIISDIELVGLSIDVAIEKIITEEVNTGYLLKGNVAAEENEISFVIEADTQKISTALEAKINEVTTNVCNELKINKVVDIEANYEEVKEDLVERAKELDPTADVEVLKSKTNAELIKYISGCQIEKFEIPTEELEALYDSIKTSRVNLSEHEFVVETIDAIDNELYQEFKNGYAVLIESLKEANTALENAYYENFVKADCDYQKALSDIAKAKLEVIQLKNELSKLKTEAEIAMKQLALKTAENALTVAEMVMDNVMKVVKSTIDYLQQGIQSIVVRMEEYQKTLPEEIKSVLTDHVKDVEEKINNAKDSSFAYFEEHFKDDIEKAYEDMKTRKQALVDSLK